MSIKTVSTVAGGTALTETNDDLKKIDSRRVLEPSSGSRGVPGFDGRAPGTRKTTVDEEKAVGPIRSFRANNYCINYGRAGEGRRSVRIYDVSKIQQRGKNAVARS